MPRPTAWRKVGQQKNVIFQMKRQLSSIPRAANIVDDTQGPVWTHGSPRRQSNLEEEGLRFGVTSNSRGAREICKVDSNIDSVKYQQILASQYIPNYKRGQIFSNRIGAPCHTSGSTMKFLRGKKIKVLQGWPASVLQMWILLSISGEEWRKKLGGPSRRTWRSFGMPARWPSMPSPRTSSTSSTTLCQARMATVLQAKRTHTIYDNYLTFSPWWNTRLIFHLLFYLLFEKDKMYWL